MSLSEDERHAWRELEQSLTAGPGTVLLQDPWTLTVPTAAWHLFLPRLVAAVGASVLLAGLIVGVPLFVIAGIIVLCPYPSRRRARDRHLSRTGADLP
jgi:Flp pilus assembly protein TadB